MNSITDNGLFDHGTLVTGLVDSHAHLNHEDYGNDIESVLARARQAGVIAILVPGYDLPSSRKAVCLAEKYSEIRAAVGIHPHDAETCEEKALQELQALLAHPRVVAVGECGLDYYRDWSPRDAQQRALRAQLALARETNRPVILHNRDADADLLGILHAGGLPEAGGVLHCFSGDATLARHALALGLRIGIAGHITFRNAGALRETVGSIPLDHLLVETDSPYLSPVPHRGHRNEPARVAAVAQCVATIHGTTLESVARATTQCFQTLFGLLRNGGCNDGRQARRL